GNLIFKNAQEESHIPSTFKNLLSLQYFLKQKEWVSFRTALIKGQEVKLEQSRYLSVWIYGQGKGETVYFDIGEISEDSNENGFLDTEDKNNNNFLDEGEDTGLDGIKGNFPQGEGWISNWNDNYDNEKNLSGTEENKRLDTEDMDGDKKLNFSKDKEKYFQYKIKVDGIGWKLYNIELNMPYKTIGKISLSEIKHMRIWIFNETDKDIILDKKNPSLKIEEINFTRNLVTEVISGKLIPELEIKQIDAKLNISGENVVVIEGAYRQPKSLSGSSLTKAATSDITQLLSICIAGTIGDKIRLNITHKGGKERDVPVETVNDIKIDYTGQKKDLVKKIVFGDIDVSSLKIEKGFPVTNVFGVMGEISLDDEKIDKLFKKENKEEKRLFKKDFKLITALSQSTNQVIFEKFTGGYEKTQKVIKDTDYIKNIYYSFWYDEIYNKEEPYNKCYKIRDPYYLDDKIKKNFTGKRSYEIIPNSEVIFIDHQNEGRTNTGTGSIIVKNKDITNQDITFYLDRQIPGKISNYTINYKTGIIEFTQEIKNQELIFIAYQYYGENGIIESIGYTLDEQGKIKYTPGVELKNAEDLAKYFKNIKCIKYQNEYISQTTKNYGTTEQRRFYNLYTSGENIIPPEQDPDFVFKVVNKDHNEINHPKYPEIRNMNPPIIFDYTNGIIGFYEPFDEKNFTDGTFSNLHHYLIKMNFKIQKTSFRLKQGYGLVKGSEKVYVDGILLSKNEYSLDDIGNLQFFDATKIKSITNIEVEYEFKPFGGLGGVNNLAGIRGEINLLRGDKNENLFLKQINFGTTFFYYGTPSFSSSEGKMVPPELGTEPSSKVLRTLDGEANFNFVLGKKPQKNINIFEQEIKTKENKIEQEKKEEVLNSDLDIKKNENLELDENFSKKINEIKKDDDIEIREERRYLREDDDEKEFEKEIKKQDTSFPIDISVKGNISYIDTNLNTYKYQSEIQNKASFGMEKRSIAMIENMEGIDVSIPIRIDYNAWIPSSPPIDFITDEMKVIQNKRGKIAIKKAKGKGKDSVDEILLFSLQNELLPNEWTGIRTPITSTTKGKNLEEYKTLEISLLSKGEQEVFSLIKEGKIKIFIDIGKINEDSDGDGILDKEDFNHNKTLDTAEDVGLCGDKPEIEGGKGWIKNWDDVYSKDNPTGTKNNGLLNTEDMDGDGLLEDDNEDSFYRFAISPEMLYWNEDRCGVASINLMLPTKEVKTDTNLWKDVKSMRLIMKNDSSKNVSCEINIESMRFVGNRWKINSEWVKQNTNISEKNPPIFKIDYINNYDKNYIEDLEFKPTEIKDSTFSFDNTKKDKIKEQSLKITYENIKLQPDWEKQAWVNLSFYKGLEHLSCYKKLRFSVYSAYPEDKLFFRFGSSDKTNQIQYKLEIKNSKVWEKIEIDLEEVKNVLKEYYQKYPLGKSSNEDYGIYTFQNGKWAIKGKPSLNNITQFFFGVENTKTSNEIWINNIIVCDIDEKKGSKKNIAISTSLSNWLKLNFINNYEDSDFSSVKNLEYSSSQSLFTNTNSNFNFLSDKFSFIPFFNYQKSKKIYDEKTIVEYSNNTLYKEDEKKTSYQWNKFSFNLISKERLKKKNENKVLNYIDGINFIEELQFIPQQYFDVFQKEKDYVINNYNNIETLDEKTKEAMSSTNIGFKLNLEEKKYFPILSHNFTSGYIYKYVDTDYNPNYLKLFTSSYYSYYYKEKPIISKTYNYLWSGNRTPYKLINFLPQLNYNYTMKKDPNLNTYITGQAKKTIDAFVKDDENTEGSINVDIKPFYILKDINTLYKAGVYHNIGTENYKINNAFNLSFNLSTRDIFILLQKKQKTQIKEDIPVIENNVFLEKENGKEKKSYFTFAGFIPNLQISSTNEYKYAYYKETFNKLPFNEILKIKLREEEKSGLSQSVRNLSINISPNDFSYKLWANKLNKKDFLIKKEKNNEANHSQFIFTPTIEFNNMLSFSNSYLGETNKYTFKFGTRNSNPYILEKGIFLKYNFDEISVDYSCEHSIIKTYTFSKNVLNSVGTTITHFFGIFSSFKKVGISYDKEKKEYNFIEGKSFYKVNLLPSTFTIFQREKNLQEKKINTKLLNLTIGVNNIHFNPFFKIWKKQIETKQTFDARYIIDIYNYQQKDMITFNYSRIEKNVDWIKASIDLTYTLLQNIKATYGLNFLWHDDFSTTFKQEGTKDFIDVRISFLIRMELR
ncbi:MAG: hypothetical protein ABIB46_03870, partial [bacterium]